MARGYTRPTMAIPGMLLDAVRNGDTEALTRALSDGVAVDARDENGWTLAFHAAVLGQVAALGALLDAGADAGACELTPPEIRLTREAPTTKGGNTLLHAAAAFGQHE